MLLTLGKLLVEVIASHNFISNSWPHSTCQRQSCSKGLHISTELRLCFAKPTEEERKSQLGAINLQKLSLIFILSLFIHLYFFFFFLFSFFPWFPCSQHMRSRLSGSFTSAPLSRHEQLPEQPFLLGRAAEPQLQLRARDWAGFPRTVRHL